MERGNAKVPGGLATTPPPPPPPIPLQIPLKDAYGIPQVFWVGNLIIIESV